MDLGMCEALPFSGNMLGAVLGLCTPDTWDRLVVSSCFCSFRDALPKTISGIFSGMIKGSTSGAFRGILVTLGLFPGMVKVSSSCVFIGILVTSGVFCGFS